MSAFDFLMNMANNTLDVFNAEPFTLVPMVRSSNGRGRTDAERPKVRGVGVFELIQSEAGGIQTGSSRSYSRSQNDLKTLVTARTPTLSISSRELEDCEPRQGDRIEMEDRGRSDRAFEIVRVDHDGHGRVMLELVAV